MPASLPAPANPSRSAAKSAGHRLAALALALASLAVLVAGAAVEPAASGHGTHTQLGMPACGWAVLLDKPCPTCGMTTAVSLACHARPIDAFLAQPAGALIALALAAGFWVCLYVAATGSSLGERILSLLTVRSLWWIFGAGLAAWAYKIAVWPG